MRIAFLMQSIKFKMAKVLKMHLEMQAFYSLMFLNTKMHRLWMANKGEATLVKLQWNFVSKKGPLSLWNSVEIYEAEPCTGPFLETRTRKVQHQIRPVNRDNIKIKSAPAQTH